MIAVCKTMLDLEATITQPAADPTPNQSSTLVPSSNGQEEPLQQPARYQRPYLAVDSTPDQHSILVTGMTLPMGKSACNQLQQIKLPQEETTPHTGQ